MPTAVPPTVLIVDDDDIVRHTLRSALEHYGFRVREAADCAEAVANYRTDGQAAAVVLLDVRLPGKDGPQTLAALHAVDAGAVACFMSGNANPYQPEELIDCGGRAFLQKPFRMRALAATVYDLLGRRPPTH